MAREVVCVDEDSTGPNDCRRITRIGYEILNSRYSKTPEEVHDHIKYDGKQYVVEHEDTETELIAEEREGTKYVKTQQNDTLDDNLLQQDDCS